MTLGVVSQPDVARLVLTVWVGRVGEPPRGRAMAGNQACSSSAAAAVVAQPEHDGPVAVSAMVAA